MTYYERFIEFSLISVYLSLIYDLYKVMKWYFCFEKDKMESNGQKKTHYLQPRLQRAGSGKTKHVHMIRHDSRHTMIRHRPIEFE